MLIAQLDSVELKLGVNEINKLVVPTLVKSKLNENLWSRGLLEHNDYLGMVFK